ncbi:MAG TPA: type II secretion system F family protein [Vitreimonas sp.]|nr:type II secretion system F family protein [Vitreimonas sp.]
MNGIAISVLLALALALFAISLGLIYLADEGVRRRLSVVGSGRREASQSFQAGGLDWLVRIGQQMQSRVGKRDAAELSELRLSLIRAGVYAEHAPAVLTAVRALLALSLSFVAAVMLFALQVDNIVAGVVLVLGLAAIGIYGPLLYIKQRGKERTLAVRRALPDAIDLLVVAMEAGSSLPQAMQRVASELNLVHPVLSQELQITMLEMQAGASRAEALRRFTERAPDDRLRSFLTLVIQSDQLGAGLANTLRVFAEELRRSRLIEAEHKAAELPVKIAVPLVFFIFPCLMGIIFTPIVIRFIRVLFQAGA